MEVGLLLLVGFGALVVPRGSGGDKMPGGPAVPWDVLGAPCDGQAGNRDGCRTHVWCLDGLTGAPTLP